MLIHMDVEQLLTAENPNVGETNFSEVLFELLEDIERGNKTMDLFVERIEIDYNCSTLLRQRPRKL